ncbi:helix-turn-helix domain-containing protein [Mesorhizobium sp. C280B]|uniref:helix-turn-helix domain-containing protein n=1 Tax=Mesorhizobium sp. C280B TaxID=2956828 RepID=UPI003338F001
MTGSKVSISLPDEAIFGTDRFPNSALCQIRARPAVNESIVLSGETLHGLAKRHELPRNLIRIWVQKYEAGSFDEDVAAADTMQTYEARIAALERLVGRQALEIEFLKGALKSAPRPRSGTTSVITGPAVSPSLKDAG